MTKKAIVRIDPGVDGFAENKDQARDIRMRVILPALQAGRTVVLDFKAVRYATQSFIHALIGHALRRHGLSALDQLEFKNCSPQLRSVIELVVDYSLGGFAESEPGQVS